MYKPLLHKNPARQKYSIPNKKNPELFRDLYPYKKISRTVFDDSFILPRPPEEIFVTDTTFRDGQQARPPYTVKQITSIFDYMHWLAGFSGLLRQCEFFLYSQKDRRAVEACLERGYRYPEVTGWIRSNAKDLDLVRKAGLKETGILTSVSDYHLYLKLGKDRRTAARDYLNIVEKSLELGIVPRCHFEDITRADIYGFCIPLAQELMRLAEQSGLPVKIRLCDTMGYGVPFPGAALPRSVGKIVRTFTDEGGVPGEWLEWHGHNDFHKAHINAVTAWLYGCAAANGTLFGFGERTGNAPVEALIIEYISLTGNDDHADTRLITALAEYFEKELDQPVSPNYPFAGRDFNATSAGIHVDGLMKNEEIYNIFDTNLILDKPVPIIINDKSGKAGIAYWINHNLELEGQDQVDKRHPAVDKIAKRIQQEYENGRTTNISHKEMERFVRRFMPEMFLSEFDHLKVVAHDVGAQIMEDLAKYDIFHTEDKEGINRVMGEFLDRYPFIQYLYLTDSKGKLLAWNVSDIQYLNKYRDIPYGQDFSDREWYIRPVKTGKLHITDFYKSFFTGKLCLTVSVPIFDSQDAMTGVLGADIQFEDLVKIQEDLKDEQKQAMY